MTTQHKQTLIINSSNKKSDNTFEYVLPSNYIFKKNDTVALESISLYNSFFNIESNRGNNKISLIWNADTTVQYDYIVPDGNYSVEQLNFWLQSKMAYDNLYLLNDDGDIIYYAEIQIESSIYGISNTLYPLPTSANATTLGYTKPASATWDFPVSDKTPQLIIPIALGTLLGFSANTYPNTVQNSIQYFTSNLVPQLSPVNSIIICSNLLNSEFSNPSNVLSSIALNKAFGKLLNYEFSDPTQYNINPSSYSSIIISFYDQIYDKLYIRDNDVVIRLTIQINEDK